MKWRQGAVNVCLMLSWGVLGPGGLVVNTVAGLLPAFGADALSVMVLL